MENIRINSCSRLLYRYMILTIVIKIMLWFILFTIHWRHDQWKIRLRLTRLNEKEAIFRRWIFGYFLIEESGTGECDDVWKIKISHFKHILTELYVALQEKKELLWASWKIWYSIMWRFFQSFLVTRCSELNCWQLFVRKLNEWKLQVFQWKRFCANPLKHVHE